MKCSSIVNFLINVSFSVSVVMAQQPITNCKVSGTFAMTFDDGPYMYEETITDHFVDAKAVTTFFLNGNNWACIYDADVVAQVQYAYQNGMLIGSHTWSHADLTTLSDTAIKQQLDLVETAFKKILGVTPAFMRPPYGSYNDHVLSILHSYNYTVVDWTDALDTEDADGATVSFSEGVFTKYIKSPGFPTPGISLDHSPYETTADQVAPFAIQKLQAAGYKLVSVAECLGLSKSAWYKTVGTPGKRDSTWTCNGTPSG